VAYTGVCPSDVILDAGTGSGVLAIYLGTIAKKVVSYEVNEQFVEVARENVAHARLANVEVRHGDVLQALREAPSPHDIGGPFDLATLDLQEAAEASRMAYDFLFPGGFLAAYSPFFEQASATRKAVEQSGFSEYTTIILGEQELEVGKRGTRPSTRVGHTGFITVARK
jgi:tRNA (adenine57-N1/adenine58-N1)-methyltransferase